MNEFKLNERFMRQLDILKPEYCNRNIIIIGCGATGSFTALSLAKMGFTNITVYDSDKVEEHNFPNQLFPLSSLNQSKALALQKIVYDFTGVEITAYEEMYEDQPLKGIVICALDSMKGRQIILENSIKDLVDYVIDPRTGAETFSLLAYDPKSELSVINYKKTLVKDEDTLNTPCTARAIIYSVLLVSGFIANRVKQICCQEEFPSNIYIDLKSNLFFNLDKKVKVKEKKVVDFNEKEGLITETVISER